MIYIENLSYEINGHKIIRNISLRVKKGSFTCIIGANGAGKSTLIKIIDALIKPTSFTRIDIDNKSLNSYSHKELSKVLSYVPQHSGLLPHFTVEEFIFTGRYPYQTVLGGTTVDDKKVVDEVMALTNTAPMKDRYLHTLSGGERQKVVIASALAQEAKVLLLDEPTIFLDPKSSSDIFALLSEINRRGVTIVMVSHDINYALLYSTDFIGMKKGNILYEGSKSSLDSDTLSSLFDIEFICFEHPVLKVMQVLPKVSYA